MIGGAAVSRRTADAPGIPKCFSNLINRNVEAIVEIHEGVGGPEFLAQIVAGDDLAGIFQQHRENLERLVLKANLQAAFAQFAGGEVRLKNSELNWTPKLSRFVHGVVLPRSLAPTTQCRNSAASGKAVA